MASSQSFADNLQLPDKILTNYTYLKLFDSGGSTCKTFLVQDKKNKFFILKYSDWEGIGYNGTPWLEMQTQRLIELKKIISYPGNTWLPEVYDYRKIGNVFYVLLEYYENAETLSDFYLFFDGDLVHSYLADIDTILTFLSTYFYSRNLLETPKDYVKKTHIERVENRLKLFMHEQTETYKRYVDRKHFSVGDFIEQDMAVFFRNLIEQEVIRINGKAYKNPLLILQSIERNKKLLDYLTPTFVPEFSHGDSLLRNYLKISDGSIKMIDVRGKNLPHNTTSQICIPFELGKMFHSIEMDIVRSDNFSLRVEKNKKNISVEFTYHVKNKNINDLLEVRKQMPNLFAQNKAFKIFLQKEPHW
ncbi:MAG TPA: hypothetical protein VLF20_02920, partial [Patescibacteria group bacterium]|nr:hypothetical protein [Patescibacteria group bacterium]